MNDVSPVDNGILPAEVISETPAMRFPTLKIVKNG